MLLYYVAASAGRAQATPLVCRQNLISGKLMSRVGRLLALKMVNHLMSNLEINSLEGPDSLINFALPKKFDERLSLLRPGRRVREEL